MKKEKPEKDSTEIQGVEPEDIILDEDLEENDPSNVDLEDDILQSLLDDLNTPKYISKLHSLYDESLKGSKSSKKKFNKACNFIGLLEEDTETWNNFNKPLLDERFIDIKASK